MNSINKERKDRKLEPIRFNKKKILKWVELNWETLQWNGRQIRNAFQTSVALAQFSSKVTKKKEKETKGPKLDVGHFKLIAEASMQFSEYLYQTYGKDEDNLAARDQVRPRAFNPKAKIRDLKESKWASSGSSSEGEEEEEDSELGEESSEEESSSEEEEEEKKPAKRGKSSKKKREAEEAERRKKKQKKKGKRSLYE